VKEVDELDFSMFDGDRLKKYRKRIRYIAASVILIGLSLSAMLPDLVGIVLLTIPFLIIFLLLMLQNPVKVFLQRNGFEKFALSNSDDYDRLVLGLRGMQDSSFIGRLIPIVYTYKIGKTTVLFGARYRGDCRFWVYRDQVMPHLVLDAVSNNKLGATNSINDKLPQQRVDLEGDFNHHFRLYCEPGQQILALQIFAPDFMAEMIDENANYDFETPQKVALAFSHMQYLSQITADLAKIR
jgi:hypothetical protein